MRTPSCGTSGIGVAVARLAYIQSVGGCNESRTSASISVRTMMNDKKCWWPVGRGGPSSGGGYDRMNRTRYEDCGKPATGPDVLCDRHREKAAEKKAYREMRERVRKSRAKTAAEAGR